MRLVIVSSHWPFGNKEQFLQPELAEIAQHFQCVTVLPVHTPRGNATTLPDHAEVLAWPLLSVEILVRAWRSILMHPARVARTLTALMRSRQRGRVKNLSVVLKGLALAQWAVEHGIDHIHAYWLSTPASVAMIAGEVASIPWSATAHRWDIYERNALDVKARSVRFVRAISSRGARDLIQFSPELHDRVVHVPIGTFVPTELPPKRCTGGVFRIVCPAALVRVKGHEDLLTALALLENRGVQVECTIAGEGPLRNDLTRRVAQLSLESSVRLVGFVPQQQLHDWYRNGHVHAVVLASREDGSLMEGIPLALVEAMAYGIPVVATTSGSIGELLNDRCGRVVSPGDPRALADALLEVFQHPIDARARAANAYARVAAEHDVRRQMQCLSEIISTSANLRTA
jgi:colanic acid/amylovoran biosynthesis glycosyltransferase